jgi:hypothetical protein
MERTSCDVGLDDRCRDSDGSIRKKRDDTLVRTLRKEYGPNFAGEFRSDMKLGTLRRKKRASSLRKVLRKGRS